jgi:hypothetical protein
MLPGARRLSLSYSETHVDFLKRVIEKLLFAIQRIQTDRGDEFLRRKCSIGLWITTTSAGVKWQASPLDVGYHLRWNICGRRVVIGPKKQIAKKLISCLQDLDLKAAANAGWAPAGEVLAIIGEKLITLLAHPRMSPCDDFFGCESRDDVILLRNRAAQGKFRQTYFANATIPETKQKPFVVYDAAVSDVNAMMHASFARCGEMGAQ